MVRLILFLLLIAAMATGLAWLADRPGELVVNWEGYEVQTSVFRAVVMFAVVLGLTVMVLSILRQLWQSPATVGHFFNRRRQKRGLDALSTGMIAIGAGDRATATRYAIQARKALPNEPLTHLLRAQAAQLTGDKATARRIFEAMLGSPDTEQLGLRGLFLEAEREGETEAARQFAERALRLNPKLSWPVDALFDLQCKQRDWDGALDTLAIAKRNHHLDRNVADRRRAVLLTAQAQAMEESDPEKALALSQEAAGLAHDLVPAATIAGRLLASRGQTPKATKIIQRTWSRAPHPDLAAVYAYARIGDSPRDRLERVKQLAGLTPNSIESRIAVATAAIDAKDFDAARKALEPLHDGRLTHRVCLLMARIEGEQHGDRGRVREWLARAVNAPRDPSWTADGVVSEQWAPVSPVTGQLDAFQWKVPVENLDKTEDALLAAKLDELVALGAPVEVKATELNADAAASGKPAAASAASGKGPQRKGDVVDAEIATFTVTPTKPASGATAKASVVEPVEVATTVADGPALRQASVSVKTSPAAAVKPATPAKGNDAAKPAAQAPAPAAKVETPLVPVASAKPIEAPVTAAVTPGQARPATAAPAATATQAAKTSAASAKPASNASTAATAASANPAGGQKAQAPAPTQQAVNSGKPQSGQTARPGAPSAGRDGKSDPRLMVPPRAPDDPGPEDDELPRSPLRSLRAGS